MLKRVASAMGALLLLLGLALQAPAGAQTPPGWSQQDMDRFVDAVGGAVAKKLEAQGKAHAAPGAVAAPGESAGDALHLAVSHFGAIVGSMPGLFRHIAALPSRLDFSDRNGLGPFAFLLSLGLIAIAGLGAEWVTRLATARITNRIAREVDPPPPWPRWLMLTLIEAVAMLAFAVAGHMVFASLFLKGGDQARLAGGLLLTLFWWRVGLSVLRCWVRPNLPGGRLTPVDDRDAALLMRGFAIVTGVPALARSWVAIVRTTGATPDEVVAQQFIDAPIVFGILIVTVIAMRAPMAHWIEELMAQRSRESWDRYLAERWHVGAILLYLLLFAAGLHGEIVGNTGVPAALNDLQNWLMIWLLAETVLYCIQKRRRKARLAAESVREKGGPMKLVNQIVGVRIGIAVVVLRIVAIEVLNLVPASAWAGYTTALTSAGFVIFAAWALWHVSNYYFDKFAGPARGPVMPGAEEPEGDDETVEGASRLRTLMPVIRTVAATLIFALTVLLVLSQLGVNITPLLAGASIFGLALSFGSQSLVRDIVSGVFYLADDAFRVGEYIDIGKAKGTVESFTLRSIRLRHQGGQIHTIPFGQLGQITNFSRDWATVKFNLRFARDTDVETLRKVSKKIGLELMEDPDLKDDFLLPLKLQGIADIEDNALVARFKFTVRPGRPSYIQRLAVKRMLQIFPEKGIEFASAMVSVKSVDGITVPPDLAAAAARTGTRAPAPAPA